MSEFGEEIGTNVVEEESDALEEEDGSIDLAERDQENESDSVTDKPSEKQEKDKVEALTEEDEELPELSKLFQESPVQIDRAVVKMISRMPVAMRILRFLHDNGGDYYKQELRKKLNLPDSTVAYNLKKLENSGIIAKFIPGPVNLRVRCYRIVNMQLASLILKRFLWLCSFKLAKVLPYNEISVEDLQKLPKFIACRKKYFLSESEAVEALLMNKRQVQAIYSEGWSSRGQVTSFRRIVEDKINPFQEGE